jgi:hypothetical protein
MTRNLCQSDWQRSYIAILLWLQSLILASIPLPHELSLSKVKLTLPSSGYTIVRKNPALRAEKPAERVVKKNRKIIRKMFGYFK